MESDEDRWVDNPCSPALFSLSHFLYILSFLCSILKFTFPTHIYFLACTSSHCPFFFFLSTDFSSSQRNHILILKSLLCCVLPPHTCITTSPSHHPSPLSHPLSDIWILCQAAAATRAWVNRASLRVHTSQQVKRVRQPFPSPMTPLVPDTGPALSLASRVSVKTDTPAATVVVHLHQWPLTVGVQGEQV